MLRAFYCTGIHVTGMKMRNISRRELLGTARKVRLLILDVDGVLTDGSIVLDDSGNELKTFHVRDGHGIRLLLKSGIRVALITGATTVGSTLNAKFDAIGTKVGSGV